jgi:N-acetylmuramoyl-L-alanine amidase
MGIKIALDAGHSDRWRGAVAGPLDGVGLIQARSPELQDAPLGRNEADLNLDMFWRVKHALGLQAVARDKVITVTATRPQKTTTRAGDLRARCARARQADCDAFVSLHFNADENPQANGLEVWCHTNDPASLALARLIRMRLLGALNGGGRDRGWGLIRDRGIKGSDALAVLNGTWRLMPAVLIEFAYLTNSHDRALWSDKHWRECAAAAVGWAIAEAIV